ncbi:MAG TPA: ATP-dependent DNA helicase RecG [Ktedonobacteraceae bacterium]|nr:ATP-dependent DNA helicase RecG [Ktedonobacteraceae bacterium]
MVNQQAHGLAANIEKARKILQHEQRTHYQDKAIRPGGLETFAAIWAEETSATCSEAGLELAPIQHFLAHLEGYRQLDPQQRARNLKAAYSVLLELEQQPKPRADASVVVEHATQPATPPKPPVVRTEKHAAQPAPQPVAAQPAPEHAEKQHSTLPQALRNPIRLEAGMTQGHTSLTLLSADITAIPGVGATIAGRLHHLGLHTIRDLLFYFPRDHRDYSKLLKINALPFNEPVTTMGLIWDAENKRTNGGRVRTIATISDETGKLYATWFNQQYLLKQLLGSKGEYLVVTGMKQRFGNKVEFSVRSHEFPERGDALNTGRIVPIYALTEGLHEKKLRTLTKWVVDHYATIIPEYLPSSVLEAGQLLPLSTAVAQIHYPTNEETLGAARRRLAFDELFLIQMGMQERRSRWQNQVEKGNAFHVDPGKLFINPPVVAAGGPPAELAAQEEAATVGSTLWSVIASDEPFEATLPFTFTNAQGRVIHEIAGDLARTKPMSRLLQGDVGAGKTAVAAATLYIAALNGYQGAIMAPTELLAEQHARSIGVMLEPFGIRTVLLTGSLKQRERNSGRNALESGQAMVAIGTHALIQEDVKFQNLGLVIVDEQHRFGVEQRDTLRQKGYHPHMLVMTATPIPRTLALTLYGDLDVSVIDQLPPGRQKIITRWRTGNRRSEANRTIAQQVAEGHQAFIICPLIEESEVLAAKAATTEYERLKREVFPNLRLGLLHGGMKGTDKDEIMHKFRDHEIDVLVATSVIEVGIDVPNATVMVIEDADRFGLSQLHQFRGRVGRGRHQSYCYVLSASAGAQAQDRLGVFQDTDDGFRLAEEDLRLRGPGDFIGVRQSGMPDLRIANLNDTKLIELTRTLAQRLWESDPYLHKPEHTSIRERLGQFWQNYMAH